MAVVNVMVHFPVPLSTKLDTLYDPRTPAMVEETEYPLKLTHALAVARVLTAEAADVMVEPSVNLRVGSSSSEPAITISSNRVSMVSTLTTLTQLFIETQKECPEGSPLYRFKQIDYVKHSIISEVVSCITGICKPMVLS